MMVSRGWGREKGKLLLMGSEFQISKMKRVLETDDSYGCTTFSMYLIPLNCVRKNN